MIFATVLAAGFAFTSCSEGEYWDEYQEEETKYSFEGASTKLSITPADTIKEVKVSIFRTVAGAADSLDIVVKSAAPQFTEVPTKVFFAPGSVSADCILKFDGIAVGMSATAQLAFASEKTSVSGDSIITVTVAIDYTWVPAGNCVFASNWAGVQDELAIEKAVECTDAHLYRVVSPYYYLEPSYCPKPGYHIEFYLDKDTYEPLTLPSFQDIGEGSSKGGNWLLYYSPSQGSTFTRQGNVFIINAFWAYGTETAPVGVADYAEEMFQWLDGCPAYADLQ